jgi:MFS family permease
VAVSSAACAFAQNYWQLLLYRGLGGIGSTMFTVSAMGLLIRLAPPAARGRVTSAYSGAFLLGGIAGPVLGGMLAGFGLHLPFLVYAAALVVAAAVVAVALRPSAVKAPQGHTAAAAVMPLAEAFRLRTYRAALISAFATGWSAFGVRMALVPLFAVAVLHAGAGAAGASLAVFAVGTALALPLAGKFADVWGRKPLVLSGLVINALAMAALGYSTTVLGFVVFSALAGVGSGLLSPAQQASVADIIGSDRRGGKVLAAFQMSQDLGTIIGPVAAGAMVDALSYGPAFAVAAATGLLAAGFWIGAGETLRRDPRSPNWVADKVV